jgi:hypothetical protein
MCGMWKDSLSCGKDHCWPEKLSSSSETIQIVEKIFNFSHHFFQKSFFVGRKPLSDLSVVFFV